MPDNLEHLLDHVELWADILDRAPRIKLLATSRERLNARGEWVVELQGLSFPHEDEEAQLSDAAILRELGQVSLDAGETAQARGYYEECRLLLRRFDDADGLAALEDDLARLQQRDAAGA